ncbi:MAG: outer membrane PBP1 activator LpoA protein [Gammaproteobacteria bacterium]|jgi:outer membrane PBP1 activator LpoA protein
MIFCPRFSAAASRCGLLLGSLLLAACVSAPPTIISPPVPLPEAVAESYLRRGDFLAAADEYARRASTDTTSKASRWRAQAALAYLDSGHRELALEILPTDPIDVSSRDPLIVLARAALREPGSDAGSESIDLAGVDPQALKSYERSVYYRELGQLAMLQRDYSAAAKSFLLADDYVLPAPVRADLHGNLWRALSHLDSAAINLAYAQPTASQRGWLDLALATRTNLVQHAALTAAIEAWRSSYQNHPADITIVNQLLEVSEGLSAQTRHVALLLPFEGPYRNAARAIRDGFISAWYGSRSSSRPTISIYALDDKSVNSVYDLAVSNGADFVVGPLEKSNVDALASRAELPVRTLTLNVADRSTATAQGDGSAAKAMLFQFGLTPENEAEEAAKKISSDGHIRAIVLGPTTPWGDRIIGRFNDRWKELGGILLDQVRYDGGVNSYAQSVKSALGIDLSDARAKELRRVLNRPIQYNPRRRSDIDAIFLAGFPVSARQIMPQLRYFRAESVPVYSTSHAFSGNVNRAADQDIDGLIFGDMPWLFGAADPETAALYKSNWSGQAPQSKRLFAFGLDAYRILPYLARMRYNPDLSVPGSTGALSMDSKGRVTRHLTWVRIAAGAPNILNR